MDDWKFIALFHNLPVSEPVGNEYIVIVPPTDNRLDDLRSRSHAFCKLTDAFTDQFGREVTPSLLLLNQNVSPDYEYLVAFRNALAFSSVSKAWERILSRGSQLEYLKFSSYFDLYPYTLSQDEHDLFSHTASGIKIDEPNDFMGQSSPELSGKIYLSDFFDKKLFSSLLNEWTNHYIRASSNQPSAVSLFRSLDMAYRASSMPELTIYDYGAHLALWVSALEILVHPKTGNAGLEEVLNLLGESWFFKKELTSQSFSIRVKRKEKYITLLQKTYHEIYNARNAFLHGNPVKLSDLFPCNDTDCVPLTVCAIFIYKCALMVSLGLFKQVKISDGIGYPEILSIIPEYVQTKSGQKNLEKALINMRKKREDR
jgi:hypothetical protein